MSTGSVSGGGSGRAADVNAARAAAEAAERRRAQERAAAQAAQEAAQQAQQAERDRLFGSNAAADPFADLSDGVGSDLEQAVQDDVDTFEDLEDAASHVETPADIYALMATAEEAGQDERRVLQALLREMDEEAEVPQTALYDAIASHFERLADPDAAIAARAAGNPDVSVDVRRELTHALQDGTDTGDDLVDAVRAARTPTELAAVMAAQRATGAGDPDHLLREALLELDEDAECANTSLINAIADEYAVLGDPGRADAVRAVADHTLTTEVRKELIHALQDDDNTEEDIEDAFEAADAANNDRPATTTVGNDRIGEAQTTELASTAAVTQALETYNVALRAAADQNETLGMAMAMMEGMPDEDINRFVEEFQSRHQDLYEAVDEARAELAEVIAANEESVTAALVRGETAAGSDIGFLEDAMSAVAGSEAAAPALERIAIEMFNNAGSIPEDRMNWLVEEVAPAIVNRRVSQAAADFEGDHRQSGLSVLGDLEGSDLFRAMERAGESVDLGASIRSKIKGFTSGVSDIRAAFEAGPAAVSERMRESARQAPSARSAALSSTLAGVSLFLGATSYGGTEGWDRIQATLSISSDGAAAAQGALRLFSSVPPNGAIMGALRGAGPVLGGIASMVGGARAIAEGDLVEGSVTFGLGALSVASAFAPIPGLNAAAAAAAGGFLVYHSVQDMQDRQERMDEIRGVWDEIGIEPGMQEFLSTGQPGAFQRASDHLELDQTQIASLVEGDGFWAENLDLLSTASFHDQLLPLIAPDGDLEGGLGRLTEGLDTDGRNYMVAVLTTLDARLRGNGIPVDLNEGALTAAIADVGGMPLSGEQREAHDRAHANLRAALGFS